VVRMGSVGGAVPAALPHDDGAQQHHVDQRSSSNARSWDNASGCSLSSGRPEP
jgi:hypothetical protein